MADHKRRGGQQHEKKDLTIDAGAARRWALELISGQVNSVDEIARREHLDKRSVRRLLRLGFLSPRIIEAIAGGNQPPDLTVFSLMRRVDLPLLWNAQEQALGLR